MPIWMLVFAERAFAQMEACPGPLPVSEWQEAMDAVDAAVVAGDGARADRILDAIVYEMRCLRTPAPPAELGRLARQIALLSFFAQDHDEMAYWALLARRTVGGAPWPEAFEVPEHYFALAESLPDPELTEVDGGLAVPKGGGVLLDGFLIRAPVAGEGAEHLVQVVDRSGEILSTRWMTGSAFPPDLLGGDPGERDVPKWYVAPPEPPPGDRPDTPVHPAPGVEPDPEPDPDPDPDPDPEPDPDRDPGPEPDPDPQPPDSDSPKDPIPQPDPAPVVEPEPIAPVPGVPVRFDGDGKTAECPWRLEPRVVEASGRSVRINRHSYPVRTVDEQVAFKKVLRACGEFRAARRFSRWQDARGAPFAGAARYREAMVEALLTEEPTRSDHPRP